MTIRSDLIIGITLNNILIIDKPDWQTKVTIRFDHWDHGGQQLPADTSGSRQCHLETKRKKVLIYPKNSDSSILTNL